MFPSKQYPNRKEKKRKEKKREGGADVIPTLTLISYLQVLFNYSYNSPICGLVQITNIVSKVSGQKSVYFESNKPTWLFYSAESSWHAAPSLTLHWSDHLASWWPRHHMSIWVNGKSRLAADKDMSSAGGREENDRAAPWVGRAGPTFPLSVHWHDRV